jgi:hypothetical protein
VIEQLVSGVAMAAPVLVAQWFISNRQRKQIEAANSKRAAEAEEAVQRRHNENQLTMQARQDAQLAQERLWRLEAEKERFAEQRACDKRIDETRAAADEKIEALRSKHDALYERHVNLMQEKAQLRVEVHDLRNELATFKNSLLPGGQRRYDPSLHAPAIVRTPPESTSK